MASRQPAIVVTGGPGGGKTTALDLFQRELKHEVQVVPESATLLFSHGLTKDGTPGNAHRLQLAVYRMQVAQNLMRRYFHDLNGVDVSVLEVQP